MRKFVTVLLCLCSLTAWAQIKVNEAPGVSAFPLVAQGKASDIYIDEQDFEVVRTVANLLAEDIYRVTNVESFVNESRKLRGKNVLLLGTIGYSRWIDKLVAEKKIDVSAIQGGWEQYVVKTLKQPFEGVDHALVIAGCDRRGTAYGAFALSEAIGVSPLYWWADVPVRQRKNLWVESLAYASKAPTVKYRGIFINDEGWGITPWAAKTFDKDLGDIGPKTYEKVCELILRMKGNMLAPAMHPGSGAFNKYPENKLVADRYGIVMTSSHCEPLLFNNTTEWSKETMGEWNYVTNKESINRVLDKRIAENGQYENFYTLAMRGIHDSGLVGVPKGKEVELLDEVLKDQRNILSRHIGQPIDSIPQLFVPYKEVLAIYENGLKVPEYVTLVWPDDNFGYIKRLSNKEERQRPGRAGVYYHISYLGEPHDYLWLNTTPSTLIYEEMKKAYDTGADRYWLLNVGDIKPGELGMKFFLDMAWNIDQFDEKVAYDYNANFLSSVFVKEYEADLKDIMNTYYLLGFQHKPELMGGGFEWNNHNDRERIIDTDFSFVNYNEAENRLTEYTRIARKSEQIWKLLPEEYKPAFYELVFYPVKGAELMNKKMLTAQKNRWYARQHRAMTNLLAEQTAMYHDSIAYYTRLYNEQLNGKWRYMMSLAPGLVATYQNMPPVEHLSSLKDTIDVQVFVPGKDVAGAVNVLPVVTPFISKDLYVELYNRGSKEFTWNIDTQDKWIKLEQTSGCTKMQVRVGISVDWEAMPVGERFTGAIQVKVGDKKEMVYLPVFRPQGIAKDKLKGWYVEDNGCVSMAAGRFHRVKESEKITIKPIKGIGYENDCVQLGCVGQPSLSLWNTNYLPRAEYDFYSFTGGNATVYVYALPVFPVDTNHDTRYGVMIDDGMVQWMTTSAKEYSSQWRINVARNSSVSVINMNVGKPGKHTLKLFCGDPGMVIQKVVIDFGGMKRSYLGPRPTLVE